jgi:hypothetical protein
MKQAARRHCDTVTVAYTEALEYALTFHKTGLRMYEIFIVKLRSTRFLRNRPNISPNTSAPKILQARTTAATLSYLEPQATGMGTSKYSEL